MLYIENINGAVINNQLKRLFKAKQKIPVLPLNLPTLIQSVYPTVLIAIFEQALLKPDLVLYNLGRVTYPSIYFFQES